MTYNELWNFTKESNKIEGIIRMPWSSEVDALQKFVKLPDIAIKDLEDYVSAIEPTASIRNLPGMDVRVGNHYPMPGGKEVVVALNDLLHRIRNGAMTSFNAHVEYETIHPFTDGNGRSGRALWLWMMLGHAPLGFLHKFYYQTLDARQLSTAKVIR